MLILNATLDFEIFVENAIKAVLVPNLSIFFFG